VLSSGIEPIPKMPGRAAKVIITATARIAKVAPRMIEQRYFPDAQFSAETVQENIAAIASLCGDPPCGLLTVFPPGIQVNQDLMNKDLFRVYREGGYVTVLAVVTDSTAMHLASKVYFTYHQQPFQVRVFEEEYEAREWLEAQLKKR
jgi:hypothetical protein